MPLASSHPSTKVDVSRQIWLSGYISSLFFTLIYLSNRFILTKELIRGHVLYKLSMLSLLISFGVSIRRALPKINGPLDALFLFKLIAVDGTPYFCLCLAALLLAPCPILLAPLSLYAVCHVTSYINGHPQSIASIPVKELVSSISSTIVKYQTSILDAATHLELLAYPLIFLGFLRGGSILMILLYPQFLRWQYAVSPKIRNAFRLWHNAILRAISHEFCPVQVKSLVKKILIILSTYRTNPLNVQENKTNENLNTPPDASSSKVQSRPAARPLSH